MAYYYSSLRLLATTHTHAHPTPPHKHTARQVVFDNGRTEIIFPALMSSEIVGMGVCNRMQV